MIHFQTDTSSPSGQPPEKSGYLSLAQIAHLMAQAVVSQHQDLALAHRSWVYATDRDEFLDFHAHQSVNENPSNSLRSQS